MTSLDISQGMGFRWSQSNGTNSCQNDIDRYRYVGASRVFDEQIRVQVYDGRFWSSVQSVIFETVVPPKIEGPSHVVEQHLEDIFVSPLLAQVDNGPQVISYELVDLNADPGSGTLRRNGLRMASGTVHEVSVGSLINEITFETGVFGPRSLDEVYFRAYNGSYHSEWKRINFMTEPEYSNSVFSGQDWFNAPEVVQGIPLVISYSFMQEFPDYETGGSCR